LRERNIFQIFDKFHLLTENDGFMCLLIGTMAASEGVHNSGSHSGFGESGIGESGFGESGIGESGGHPACNGSHMRLGVDVPQL
jgi:hypothetical protein